MEPELINILLISKHIPGLENHILHIEGGSPAAMRRYTANHEGAAYGWNVSPSQVGPARIPNQSPIKSLYFSSHWTTPGGVYGVSLSGVKTALKISGVDKQEMFWRMLKEEKIRQLWGSFVMRLNRTAHNC
jgi:phytoene dehydrogenase-like protein